MGFLPSALVTVLHLYASYSLGRKEGIVKSFHHVPLCVQQIPLRQLPIGSSVGRTQLIIDFNSALHMKEDACLSATQAQLDPKVLAHTF